MTFELVITIEKSRHILLYMQMYAYNYDFIRANPPKAASAKYKKEAIMLKDPRAFPFLLQCFPPRAMWRLL